MGCIQLSHCRWLSLSLSFRGFLVALLNFSHNNRIVHMAKSKFFCYKTISGWAVKQSEMLHIVLRLKNQQWWVDFCFLTKYLSCTKSIYAFSVYKVYVSSFVIWSLEQNVFLGCHVVAWHKKKEVWRIFKDFAWYKALLQYFHNLQPNSKYAEQALIENSNCSINYSYCSLKISPLYTEYQQYKVLIL